MSEKDSRANTPVFTTSTKKNSLISMKKQVKACKPVVLSHDIPPGTKLTFVDISHSLCTLEVDSKLNKFSALIETANEWLQKNYLWKVENCETVGLVFKNEKLDPMDFGATQRLVQPSNNYDLGDCYLLKALRLWIARREDVPEMKKHVDIQTIAYQTFLPQGCRFYENQIGWQQLDDIIETINDSIRCGLITGQILNLESINYDANEEWVVDTECPKQKEYASKQETALRLFYVSNASDDCLPQEVAVFDFIPDIISSNPPPKFEPFSTLLYKLQDFMEDNPEYKYLNSQSVDIKFRSLDEIHTHYMVHNNDIGYYLRILRFVCIKPSNARLKRLERQMTFESTSHPNEVQSEEEVTGDKKIQSPDTKVADEKGSVFNIESHFFEIIHHNTLHGPFYPVKRAIEDFMERPEWVPNDERQPNSRWKYLCAETINVLAKDETDIGKRVEMSLFSNRHSIFILMPRVYNAIRIYFDTSDVIPNHCYKTTNKSLLKSKSESFDKRFKTLSFRNQSLPDAAIQYLDNTNDSVKTIKDRITQSVSCNLM